MDDRQFTHANYGKAARVEVWGTEVRLIFIADTESKANDLADSILAQMKEGAVTITMMGRPTSVVEE